MHCAEKAKKCSPSLIPADRVTLISRFSSPELMGENATISNDGWTAIIHGHELVRVNTHEINQHLKTNGVAFNHHISFVLFLFLRVSRSKQCTKSRILHVASDYLLCGRLVEEGVCTIQPYRASRCSNAFYFPITSSCYITLIIHGVRTRIRCVKDRSQLMKCCVWRLFGLAYLSIRRSRGTRWANESKCDDKASIVDQNAIISATWRHLSIWVYWYIYKNICTI